MTAFPPVFIRRHAPSIFGINICTIRDEDFGDRHTFGKEKWRHTSIAASVNVGSIINEQPHHFRCLSIKKERAKPVFEIDIRPGIKEELGNLNGLPSKAPGPSARVVISPPRVKV